MAFYILVFIMNLPLRDVEGRSGSPISPYREPGVSGDGNGKVFADRCDGYVRDVPRRVLATCLFDHTGRACAIIGSEAEGFEPATKDLVDAVIRWLLEAPAGSTPRRIGRTDETRPDSMVVGSGVVHSVLPGRCGRPTRKHLVNGWLR